MSMNDYESLRVTHFDHISPQIIFDAWLARGITSK